MWSAKQAHGVLIPDSQATTPGPAIHFFSVRAVPVISQSSSFRLRKAIAWVSAASRMDNPPNMLIRPLIGSSQVIVSQDVLLATKHELPDIFSMVGFSPGFEAGDDIINTIIPGNLIPDLSGEHRLTVAGMTGDNR